MKTKKKIVDTTLRDGEQCPGIVFGTEDKIRLGLLLDELGVYEIEAGCVDVHSSDMQYIDKLMGQKKNAKVSLWSRMRQEDVETACLLQPDLIHIGVPVSYVQIYSKLNKNKVWVQREIKSCLEIANNYSMPVTVGLEDATRADIGFILSLVRQLYSMGVKTVRIADTVGTVTPERGAQIIKEIHNAIEELTIEIHEHNDLGMAIANSILMAKAGGEMIDCTLLGLGERVGNCNLYDFVRATETIFDCGVDKKKIQGVEQELIDILQRGVG
ncbi:homocitrate synthase [Anaerosporobacter sp.]|uniref:homocitrate synthase n=1 Tax=Anaerosporobacter sp. TaxID=1872529 RepID=UPI00286EFFF1|nr:homocitrate synthase [Anaerosporobacter sp.]